MSNASGEETPPPDPKADKKVKRFRLDERTLTLCGRLWREYMIKYWGRLVVAVLAMIVVALCDAAMARLVEPSLDKAFGGMDPWWLWFVAIAYLVVSITRGTGNFCQSTLMHNIGLRIIENFQNQMFSKLQSVEVQFLHDEGTGRQLSRFSNDAHILREAITKVFTGAGRDVVKVLALTGVMFYQNWQLAIVAFVFFPIAIFPIARIGRRLRKVSTNTQGEYGQMMSVLDDSLKNARQVRAYGMRAYEETRAEGVFGEMYRLIFKSAVVRSLSYPIMDTLSGFTLFIILIIGGFQILDGQQTVGSFMSFFFAVFLAYQPMRSLAAMNATLQEGLAAAFRIFTLIDYEPKIRDKPDAKPLKPGAGTVELEGVRFTYKTSDEVLHGVDLSAPAGQTVALVGPSGSGKSTILNLIPRFYDVGDGCVRIDGQDVRDVTLESLMAQIGLVSQEPALFNDTVRANIAYGKMGATDAEIVEAAKGAAAHEFIDALPQGYDTMVGEMGIKLSGGQRQRIAIARAMLKNAPILLLDEATSALDTESERQVQTALKRLMAGRTTIVIAHRLSTIVDADRIYVLEGGNVVESGTHRALLERDGLYARLCHLQLASGEFKDLPKAEKDGAEPRDLNEARVAQTGE